MFAVPLAVVTALPTAAAAQQITTSTQGQLVSEAGQAVPNAIVTVTDTRTGNTQEFTTNAQGLFNAQNLTTGGPYQVTATADGFQGQTVEGINTSLQGATELTFTLTAVSADSSGDTI